MNRPKRDDQRSSKLLRVLAQPVVLVLVGGVSFWAPFAISWLLFGLLEGSNRYLRDWSFIVLAPGTLWGVTYCWYRFVLPMSKRTIRPALWMGIVGALMSTWISAIAWVLFNEVRNGRAIWSFNVIVGSAVEAIIANWFINDFFGMVIPQWIAIIGSGLIGVALSRCFGSSAEEGR